MKDFFTCDKELLEDCLNSQKYIETNYNIWANECTNCCLRDDLMNILSEEHAIQAELFTEMQSRGWYATEAAPEEKISKTRKKLEQAMEDSILHLP